MPTFTERLAFVLAPISGSTSVRGTLTFLWVVSATLPIILLITWILGLFHVGTGSTSFTSPNDDANHYYSNDDRYSTTIRKHNGPARGGGLPPLLASTLISLTTVFCGVALCFSGRFSPALLIGFVSGAVFSLSVLFFAFACCVTGWRVWAHAGMISGGAAGWGSIIFILTSFTEAVVLALFGACLCGDHPDLIRNLTAMRDAQTENEIVINDSFSFDEDDDYHTMSVLSSPISMDETIGKFKAPRLDNV